MYVTLIHVVEKIGQLLVAALPMKGWAIFRDFAADKDFGTYHMLFPDVMG